MSDPNPPIGDLAALSRHFATRRDALLNAWRAAVAADPAQTTGASLPRALLNDHIPALLVDFESALAAESRADAAEVGALHDGDAAAHGLHRWQQGFDLSEVVRELARLNECVVAELDTDAAARAGGVAGLARARRIWAAQHGTAVAASAARYFELQQLEASGHISDLEHALEGLRELEHQRALLWQQAAHDLRGNLGVVANATAGLTLSNASDDARARFLRLLDRNVGALHHLLDDVTSLARLQGGHEQRTLRAIDAASLLRDLCDDLDAHAGGRGLTLHADGPAQLPVQTDPVKARRIAQNLVLNAVKYTRRGGVTVSWGLNAADDARRWFLQVEDTGPGFHAGPGAALVGAIESATDQARRVTGDARTGHIGHADGHRDSAELVVADTRAVQQQPGEGIGLSIVKRLCELLDATIELESRIDVGTRVRILLPLRYDA